MEEKMSGLDKSNNGEEHEGEEEEEEVMPGFRFHPSDEELVGFYLRRKVEKKSLTIEIIKQIDIYKYEPWDLPKVSTSVGDKEWYFFCLRGRKYRNSVRPNRVTGAGFWKATGIDRPIYSSSSGAINGVCIGLKKSLVYYRGSAGKGTKTDWMMHEFRLPSSGKNAANDMDSASIHEAENWTICRIFKRNISYKKYGQVWKDPSDNKQIPADSSSKTCSAESDTSTGDEYKHFAASAIHQQGHENMSDVINYFEDKSQFYTGQWNPLATQAPLTAFSHSNFPSSNTNDFFKDGSWDELGRIMEFAVDPTLVNECRYSYS